MNFGRQVKDKKRDQGKFFKQKVVLERKIAKERMKVDEKVRRKSAAATNPI